jgi:hypothetical protein
LTALFVCLISYQPAVLLSQNKPATSNQPTILFSQNKPAPVISHQPNEQADAIVEYDVIDRRSGSINEKKGDVNLIYIPGKK